MTDATHIYLLVEDGPTQAVEAVALPNGCYEVARTPGFVDGIAAGDVVRITNPKTGAFELVSHGGNLAILIWAEEVEAARAFLDPKLEALGGRCDGAVTGAAVYTVPVASGFDAISAELDAMKAAIPGAGWGYNNVYGKHDLPLNWWL